MSRFDELIEEMLAYTNQLRTDLNTEIINLARKVREPISPSERVQCAHKYKELHIKHDKSSGAQVAFLRYISSKLIGCRISFETDLFSKYLQLEVSTN